LTYLAALSLALAVLAPQAARAEEAKCPAPPANHLYFDGTLSEGTLKLGSKASASGIEATISCGLINLVGDTVTVPAANVSYKPFQLHLLGLVPLETTISLDGPAEGSMSAVLGENELHESITVGYNSSLTAPVTSTVNVSALGVGLQECSDGPLVPTLTTGKSGSLEGTLLKGSLATSLEGTLVANEFAVPRIQPSASCSIASAELSNTLLGLPLAPGESSITSKATLKVQ
jgi:hypothetical protein